MSLRHRVFCDCVYFTNFVFLIKYHFTLVFNFYSIVILFYRAIRVFLVQNISYLVAMHGHAT
jgi:hypothetical protein